jgi:hypothetical protein
VRVERTGGSVGPSVKRDCFDHGLNRQDGAYLAELLLKKVMMTGTITGMKTPAAVP